MTENVTSVNGLREEIDKIEKNLAYKRVTLKAVEDACQPHSWEGIDNRIDVQRAYTIPGWKAGVDFSPEIYVPEKRTVYHRRRCVRCGLIDKTDKTKVSRVEHVPDFR